MSEDFIVGFVIGAGVLSWVMAMWIWFLLKTKLGRSLVKRFQNKKIN